MAAVQGFSVDNIMINKCELIYLKYLSCIHILSFQALSRVNILER